MDVVWAIVILALGLLAWLGQSLAWLIPDRAQRLGLVESEAAVEPVYWADIRGEALWDMATLWVLPVTGVLLLMGHWAWAPMGLIAGGMYVYFGGRGITTRREMLRRGLRIGDPSGVRTAIVALATWAIVGGVTALAAIAVLAREA